jgi:DNA mismatch repair protein MutL
VGVDAKGSEAASGAGVRVLDPIVAQQVAAGEVVDRPASVVKELVENALDAGASRVEVELGDGGATHILVRDDGSGMAREDAALSVLRHATSKIRTAKDLETVHTLGFRGEALPSIASVSSFCLTTSTGEGSGTRVVVDGGGEAEVSPASHPKGTTILVDRLFYNVPARRAFLRGARAERAAIVEVLTHLAVAHPSVAGLPRRAASTSRCPPRRASWSASRRYTGSRRPARCVAWSTSPGRSPFRATPPCRA